MEQQREQQRIVSCLAGHIYRRINGQIHNLFEAGKPVTGDVQFLQDNVVIGYWWTDQTPFALTNFQSENLGDISVGKRIGAIAIRIGIYNWNGTPVALYDCGMPVSQEEEEAVESKITQEQAQREKDTADAEAWDAANERKAAIRNHFEAESNAVIQLATLATNGQEWAQTSLGEHYLKGEGCQTNLPVAIFWLTKSAGQGDSIASNDLVTLKQ